MQRKKIGSVGDGLRLDSLAFPCSFRFTFFFTFLPLSFVVHRPAVSYIVSMYALVALVLILAVQSSVRDKPIGGDVYSTAWRLCAKKMCATRNTTGTLCINICGDAAETKFKMI